MYYITTTEDLYELQQQNFVRSRSISCYHITYLYFCCGTMKPTVCSVTSTLLKHQCEAYDYDKYHLCYNIL